MSADPVRPNFFIVGAPKCGTTAMDRFLGAHPEVFVADRKEIHYFGRDLELGHPRVRNEVEYFRYFCGADGFERMGESSVYYLMSRSAAEEINTFAPDARIIVMLRNPVDVLYSLHSQRLYGGSETIEDFEEAMAADIDASRRSQRSSGPDRSYRGTVCFTDQVARYLRVFGPERVHVIIFDDFKAETADVYRRTLAFLGVDPSFRAEFHVVNANKRVRSRLVRRMLYQNRFARSYAFRRWIPEPLRAGVRRLNMKESPRPPMAPALRAKLTEELAPEVERLGRLLDRDLSAWSR